MYDILAELTRVGGLWRVAFEPSFASLWRTVLWMETGMKDMSTVAARHRGFYNFFFILLLHIPPQSDAMVLQAQGTSA